MENVTLIFDPVIKLDARENMFSFDYDINTMKNYAIINFHREPGMDSDIMTVSKVCYLMLGSKIIK